MITDQFEHVSEVDEKTTTLWCKGCSNEFEANFDILQPLNVVYVPGKKLTMIVTCPHCKATATTGQAEFDLLVLTALHDKLRADIDQLMETTDVHFTILDDRYSATFAYFNCVACTTQFQARSRKHPDGPLNTEYVDDTFSVICPGCGAADTLSDENAEHRKQLSRTAEVLRIVTYKLREMENENND